MHGFGKTVCLAAMWTASQVAQAGFVAYTDRAAFLAAVSSPFADTYDDRTPGTTYTVSGLGTQTPLERVVGPYSYEVRGIFKTLRFIGTPEDVILQSDGMALHFSDFSDNIYAFGGDFPGRDASSAIPGYATNASLFNAAGEEFRYAAIGTSNFLGFISLDSPLVRVSVSTVDTTTANNVTLAGRQNIQQVPEPSSLALALVSLAAVLGVGRRPRKARA